MKKEILLKYSIVKKNKTIIFLWFFITSFLISPVALASSITDTFTETAGTLLENHISDNGNTWTKQTGLTGSVVITNSNRVRSNASAGSIYLSNWTPSSADYDVSADLYFASALGTAGIGGRAGSASFTGYYVTLANATGKLYLYRGGNGTPLGTYTATIVVGATHSVKLEMRGTHLKVYWDGSSVIDVTATGADIVSEVGAAATYFQYATTDTTGFHLDNFLAQDSSGTLSAGVLSETTHTSSSTTVSWTDASGGVTPITAQLQRSASGADTWSNISGATASPVTDTGLSESTAYDYRVAYTDATPTTVYSNTVTITTNGASTTYAIQQADLWDNGYDNVVTPRQSNFARFVFTTDAANVTIGGTTSIYNSYPQFSHLGVRVNGVNQSSLVFTANGPQSFTVSLGTAGTTRTVEIISGTQSKPSSTVIGSFIDSVTYANTASFAVQTPTTQTNRILVYGDSIAAGGNATNPEIEAYVPLLRDTYGHSMMMEAWGYRTLYDDTNTSGLRSAFVSRLAGYTPSIILMTIGTNDYGLNKWNAANFGTAYAATLDDLHTALPSARIVCQTPIVRATETANSFGNTTGDYRNQISTVCNARSWTTLVDGTTFLTISDLADGSVHPSTAGFAKYALKINDVLTITPTLTTSAASSVLSTSATLNGSISSIGSTTPTIRGFAYGLTTAYEIATTTDSGSFSTGNFNASISNLTSNTTYHFRSYATNFAGTAYGTDQIFTTLDTTAPTRSGGSPTGTQAFGTASISLALTTNENATCKYSTTADTAYGSMTAFSTTGLTSHSKTISDLSNGLSYTYYVKCQDTAENTNDTDYLISFSVASEEIIDNDGNTDEDNDNEKDLNVHSVKAESTENTITIAWKTDYNTKSSIRYGIDRNLKQKKKDNQKEKNHKVTLKNLLPDTKYYFKIKSEDGNDNTDSSKIHSIKTQPAKTPAILVETPRRGVSTGGENTNFTPNICNYTVQSGDMLWSIAKKVYGDAKAYPLIIEKNKDKYPDIGSKLSIGQELSFCDNNQNSQTTGNNLDTDNSNQQSQAQPKIESQTSPSDGGFKWYNPVTWF